jgi:hypothetical protein
MATERRSIPQLSNRGRLASGLALALTATALVIPGAAAAVPGGAPGGGNNDVDQAAADVRDQSGVTLRRDGSKAVPYVAYSSGTATAEDSAGGFDWGDAMLGAGGAFTLVALIGAGGLTIRSRRHVAPVAPSQG